VGVAVGEVTVIRVVREAILIVMERNIPVGEYLVCEPGRSVGVGEEDGAI